MWVPAKVFDWFKISQESFNDLRERNAVLVAECEHLKSELAATRVNTDWLRFKVNQLELEKALLTQKAFDINLPVPEIARRPQIDPSMDPSQFSLEDMGDELARKFGLPTYDTDH